MSTYTGSLQPKKKQELQGIALALNISDSGTRDELQSRIKTHLSQNEVTLAEDPKFGGLYGRTRKRSVQPQMQAVREDAISVSSEDHDDRVRTMSTRKVSRQQAPRKTPPPNDSTTKVMAELEPANLPPLPPSPIPSAVSQVVSAIGRDTTALVQEVRQHQRSMAVEGHRLLKNTQGFLSDATNIYTITLLVELTLMLYSVLPFSHLRIPLNAPYKLDDPISPPSTLVASIPYPTPSYFLSGTLWAVLAKWSLPTLVIPQLCGALISFSVPPREVDPVTIGIVRVACTVASRWGITDDILGSQWRILSASVGAAFAFAEAVGQRRRASLLSQSTLTSQET
ncbi:hypothetical protein JB92DRAFT_2831720 [Gautieria morchelliformis]|nr:hypothetical protein JB92DRAFT_2831720 [Gautieria morchelliformis]